MIKIKVFLLIIISVSSYSYGSNDFIAPSLVLIPGGNFLMGNDNTNSMEEGFRIALDGSKISNQGVERRYQINLAAVQEQKVSGSQTQQYIQRFKITMNRSKIINIEGMKSEQNY